MIALARAAQRGGRWKATMSNRKYRMPDPACGEPCRTEPQVETETARIEKDFAQPTFLFTSNAPVDNWKFNWPGIAKLALAVILLILLGIGATFFLTGCSFLAGVDAAKAAYTQTQADVAQAKEKYEALARQLVEIKTAYDAAVKSGDQSKAAALLDAGQKTFAQWEAAREAYDASATAFTNAARKLKESETASDYIGNIVGIGLGILGGLFGGGAGVGGFMNKQLGALKGAAKVTAANADTFVPEDQWEAFTKSQREKMTPAQRAAFDAAAGL